MIDLRDGSSSNAVSYNGNVPVDKIVLQAVLYKFLVKADGHAWVTSFSLAINWDPEWILDWANFHGLIVTAAANDHNPEPPGEFPQSLNPAANFVTVTTGARDGTVFGGYSLYPKSEPGEAAKGPKIEVHVLAPGCGYDYDLIEKGDFGTSYATPFVAAFTWAEHLADNTKTQRARDALISSSEMRLQDILIASKGVFEPSLITAGSESWYAKYDSSSPSAEPTAVQIAGGDIHINYVDETRTLEAKTITTRHVCSLSLLADDQGNLSVRDRGCIAPNAVATYAVPSVSSCSFTDAAGSKLSICKNGEFHPPAKDTLLHFVFGGENASSRSAAQ